MSLAVHYSKELTPAGHDDLQEAIDDIDEGIRRIHKIVSGLRVFAYPTHDDECKNLIVNDIIDSALTLVSFELKEMSIKRNIEPIVTADEYWS